MGLEGFTMNEQLFTGRVDYYEKARPEVASEAVDYLCSLVSKDAVFADIGAGTGKFTSLIAERGYSVYAVEPNHEMHSVLSDKLKDYSNVDIICASAEFTRIPASSVDVVVVVTALHWFDLRKFSAECLRILKPDGFVVVIYNSRKEELRSSIGHSKDNATYKFFDGHYNIVEFPNTHLYSREEFIAYKLSHATAPKIGDDNFDSYMREILSDFDSASVDGRYCFEFISVLYIDDNFIHNKTKMVEE